MDEITYEYEAVVTQRGNFSLRANFPIGEPQDVNKTVAEVEKRARNNPYSDPVCYEILKFRKVNNIRKENPEVIWSLY